MRWLLAPLCCVAALTLLGACSGTRSASAAGPAARPQGLLIFGGSIYRGRLHESGEALDPVGALLAMDGVVVDTGELEELEQRWDLDSVERLNLAGATAVPGLQDGHLRLGTVAEGDGDREAALLSLQEQLLAQGLTCVHDLGTSAEQLGLYRSLEQRGLLRLRIAAYLDAGLLDETEGLEDLLGDRSAPQKAWVAGVRLEVDGELESKQAALLEAYADGSEAQGSLLLERPLFLRRMRLCARLGLQPAALVRGDRAAQTALDVLAQVSAERPALVALRPRLEQLEVVAPEDQPRLGTWGILPSVQPHSWSLQQPWIEDHLGAGRLGRAHPLRSLQGTLSPLVLGSRFPDAEADPRRVLHGAVTRDEDAPEGAPVQALGPAESLEAMAFGAAYALSQERERGRLEPGYACDLSVFDRDPMGIPKGEFAAFQGARCLLTLIDGRIEYDGR